VVRFLPRHATTIVETIRDATAASFGVGLLTGIIGFIVIAVLLFTVCLAPLGTLLILPLAFTTLLGWTMVGYWLGQHIMPLLSKRASPEPMVIALVGTLVLTAGQQALIVLSATPCLGFFFRLLGTAVWVIAAAVGLGAVVLSRFGTQRYPTAPSPVPLQPLAGSQNKPLETAASTLTAQSEASASQEENTGDGLPRRRTPRRKRTGSDIASQETLD
jgi:hypothetical protein